MVDYKIEGKIAVITGCSDDEKEINIPEEIDGYPVGKIEANSFNDSKIKKITFPKSLKVIGSYAFAGCKNLKEVYFSEGLEAIEDWAFISCDIDDVALPTTIKIIGENAFMGNMVKNKIDDFIINLNKSRNRGIKSGTLTIFPIGLFDSLDNITGSIIVERSKYHANQIDSYDNGTIDFSNLDIPFVFDDSEFIIAFTSKTERSDLRIDITPETRKKLGVYDIDNPDFFDVRFHVLSGNDRIGELVVKTPYCEDASFSIIEVLNSNENNQYNYFLRVKADLSCFGNDNPNSQFKFNLFDELKMKFNTQLKRQLITKDVYDEIESRLDETGIDTLKSYIEQVIGCPILNYVNQVYHALMEDSEFENKDNLEKYFNNLYKKAYATLGSFESLVEFIFNQEKTILYITRQSGLALDEIKDKYGIYLSDDDGNELSLTDMKAYQEVFVENEFNFEIYGDFLNYIYQMMSNFNNEFSMRTFQE